MCQWTDIANFDAATGDTVVACGAPGTGFLYRLKQMFHVRMPLQSITLPRWTIVVSVMD
jgi:hypothetical protein